MDALYLADREACDWAEWYRHLAERAVPPNFALPRDLWAYEVTSFEVADIGDRKRLGRVDLDLPQPGRHNWPAYQATGEQLQREGWRVLMAPSAARLSSCVLVVYPPDLVVPAEIVAARCTRIVEPPAPPTGMRT